MNKIAKVLVNKLHFNPNEHVVVGIYIFLCIYGLQLEYSQTIWSFLTKQYSVYDFMVTGTSLIGFVVYWSYSLVLLAIDQLNAFQGHKVQDGKYYSKELYYKCVKQVLFNQFVISFPMLILYSRICPAALRDNLPTAQEIFKHLAVCGLIEEILFYYGHRLMHHPQIYKQVHKQHHLFQAPVGMAAAYAHPLEHIINNMIPILTGPILLESHIVTFWIWLVLAIFTVITTHSGYRFFGFPSCLAHDYHHYAFNSNFGVLGVLDLLHNTDKGFAEYLEKWDLDHHNLKVD